MQNNTLKLQEDWVWPKRVMIFLLESTFFGYSETLRHWQIKFTDYQDKLPLCIMLKPEQMIVLT